MKISLRPRTINEAFAWLLAGILGPLLLGVFALLALQASQEHQQALGQLNTVARTLVKAVDAELDRSRAQLEVLAASPTVDEADWYKMRTFAGEITRNVPGSLIVLVGPDGQVLFNTVVPWGQALPNLWKLGAQNKEALWEGRPLPLSSGNLSKQAFESGKPVYSDLYYGVQIHRPAMAVSIPVVRAGRSRYALIMSYPPALLQQMFHSAVDLPGMRALLVDRQGVVVAANELSAARVAEKVMNAVGVNSGKPHGTYRILSRDGDTWLSGAYAVSPVNNFIVRVSQPAPPRFFPTRLGSLGLAALLLGAMATALVLAFIVSRRLALPLRQLAEDVSNGRAVEPSRKTGILEIDLLTQALAEGAQSERQRAEEQALRRVAESREAMLRQADRQKDEFLATLAHELRNPLAPIRTAAELIRRREPADPVIRRAQASIERQASHLTRLVDDLLDVSRVTLGRIQLQQEPVDLGAVAAAAAEVVAGRMQDAGLLFEQHVDPALPQVMGDATRLTQCLVNLLVNAAKFTPAGGRVRLEVRTQPDGVLVEVSDTGIGIGPEDIDRVFDLFAQVRQSGRQGHSGLGIGLFLTRKIIDLHGGEVSATSAGANQGTTFRVRLPLAEGGVGATAGSTSHVAASGIAGRQVLVVDDNRDAAETLCELLQLAGAQTRMANDAESAIRMVRSSVPDAVLLDIGLPGMDGYEACRQIRATLQAAAPLMVAVTGWGQSSDRNAAAAAGFDAHLTKPVAPQALLQLLAERLAARIDSE